MDSEEPSSSCYLSLLPLLAIQAEYTIALEFLLLFLLLLASALISGSEVAFFSLSKSDMRAFEEEDSTIANRIIELKNAPRRLLATILIANNFINIAIVIVSDFLVWHLVSEETFTIWAQEFLAYIEWTLDPYFLARIFNFIITVLGVTFLLVLFGEVAPKVYANINYVKLSRFMSSPLYFLNHLLSPLSNGLVSMSKSIEKRIAGNTLSRSGTSRDDIDRAIELTVQHDPNAEQEMDILKSIVKFGDVTVKQIMCSRVDVVSLDVSTLYDDLLSIIKISGYSRIPVYEEDFDNIIGILYVKDLLGYLDAGPDFEWNHLVRKEVLYVPENKKINELLKEFQSKRLHMGIVVDEYGGSAGIVTLEDVMEEVIGDIKDEFDQEEEVDYVKLNRKEYIFEGKTLLNDVCRLVGVPTDTFDPVKGDADSIAGLLLEMMGRMPIEEQEVRIESFKIKVLSVSKRRIKRVKLTLLE